MYESVTIKVGSNVLTNPDGTLDYERITHLSDQISELCRKGIRVILVSSGAVAAGRAKVPDVDRRNLVSSRQLLSAVGQVSLLNTYSELFSARGITCAQVLVTKQDFRTREHYLNMQNCFSVLLENHLVPIVNENDTVSVTELMFTDNDELAGMVASMMNTDACFILSNVDGIFTGVPGSKQAELIEVIDDKTGDIVNCISDKKSSFGRGGMLTKIRIARNMASAGIAVHIARGSRENVICDLVFNSESVPHTRFVPQPSAKAVKKWIACSAGFTKWEVKINKGAADALYSAKATSLLLAGVVEMKGDFKKGDLLKIFDEDKKLIGIGRAKYDRKIADAHKNDKRYRPLIHYDYLYLFPV
jgi:glutamate 5-kinase